MGDTTLILLDVQNGVLDQLKNTDPYLNRLAFAVLTARNQNVKIIHVVTAFRPGYPESSPLNTSTKQVAESGLFQEGDHTTQIPPMLAPTPHEVIIKKRRISAFFGTELDMILRCSNINHIIIAGLVTSGSVLSTVRDAMDLDYGVTVLRDLCMDRDEEVHRVLMDKVFKRRVRVVNWDHSVDFSQSFAALCRSA